MKAKIFWHRLSLATKLIKLINENNVHIATSKQDGLLEIIREEEPIFRTNHAKMIWDITKQYPAIMEVVLVALKDAELYNFDVCSSINASAKDDSARWGKVSGYKNLIKTRLLEHTYHVVFYASTFKNEVGGHMPTLLLLALFHDYGKNEHIILNHKPLGYSTHEEVSANYAKYLLKNSLNFRDSDDFIALITKIITTHHNGENNTMLYKYLNKADQTARELEKR